MTIRLSWASLAVAFAIGAVCVHPGEATAGESAAADSARPVRFNRDIRPILSQTCFQCHGPDENTRQADLRLDTAGGAMADLGGSAPIVPGDLAKSEAWTRIVSNDPDTVMPPPESHLTLTAAQRATIRDWIEQGATYEGHWAFQTPVRPIVPELADDDSKAWVANEIDAFVMDGLRGEKMRPSPPADPRTLIRRLTLDLTGLPPTLSQVHSFVDDFEHRGEAAWQDAITRLLDSRHFGERMATPWLDAARYADTNGYSIDGGRSMWLWRDWVIESFNNDLPMDQLLTHQLAGDLLPGATDAQRIATGFNRNHMVTHEGGTIPEENLTNYAADRVKTTAEVFLGLTMGCAQCHDHKYDPISQREYYEFFAFFNSLSDRGLDGNGGVNPGPSIMARTVLPADELPDLKDELSRVQVEWTNTRDGFDDWLESLRREQRQRGEGFSVQPAELLDVSSPNTPGEFTFDASGVHFAKPAGSLHAMSHVVRLAQSPVVEAGSVIKDEPGDVDRAGASPTALIHGVRIGFVPDAQSGRLTPHGPGVPQITTVLISAGDQPAAQVDIHRQVVFSGATASSFAAGHEPAHVLDERNDGWWKPTDPTQPQHLTLTFAEPIDPAVTDYLSVMIFFGVNESIPHHTTLQAFTGRDTDTNASPELIAAIGQPDWQWTVDRREFVLSEFRRSSPSLAPLRTRIDHLTERIDVLTRPHPTMVMDTAAQPRETFVLARGQYDARGEKVTPGTLAVLPPLVTETTATRLDLARWLTDPDHPLTSRVMVNRIWAMLLGRGLVATSADFGSQGAYPSHPELLDHLAIDFVAHGWDPKRLIRQIVSSATYRQDSRVTEEARRRDPDNRWLGRGSSFRLPAEFIRDAALHVSGLLVPRIGGPSVFPYQPPGLWKEVSHFGSTPATLQVFVQDQGEKLYRRSLYTVVKRTSPHPAMAALDAPNREMCVVDRGATNTPLQALVMLNDVQFTEAARVWATGLLAMEIAATQDAATTQTKRLSIAFETATSRPPTPAELATLESFLTRQMTRYAADEAAAESVIRVGQAPVPEFIREGGVAERAAWTQVASLLMNLSESMTRR